MEFGVLGPLEIRDGAKAIELPPQRRDLLALLLCRPGTVVSADALVDGLWGEDPPRSAAKSLQVQLHHLRRVLDDERRLAHRPPGYLLTVEPDELDAARFERLVERGRTALAERRTAEGADLLRQALTLWRGPAFAGLDHLAMAADEAQRLAEQRRMAEEGLLGAELDLGNHADVVGRLTALVTEHPFQERPRAQLMLALHRLGRRAEALDVYREGRKALADELGLEPGPRLRDLERAILVNDPALDPSRPESSSPRVPAELPLDIATFTGRSGEVDRLSAMLTADSGSPVVAAINGVGGSGKSALAVRTAHEVAAAFPEHDNLLAAVRQAATAAGDEGSSFTAGLAAALFRPFDMRGRYEDRVTVGRLAFAAACRTGDLCAEAQALNDLGWACLVAGDVDAAVDHLERSVARWRQTDMRLGLASSVANLGLLYAAQGKHEPAIVNCRWSIEVFREVGDRNGEARALINLGGSHLREGRYPEAIAANVRSLELHTELGHPRGQAIASGNLAEAHRLNGSPELAVPLFERAIVAIREVGDRGAEAEFHWFLGNALHTMGHPDLARDRWRRSVALLQDMGALSADEAEAILACPVPDTPEPILRTM